jgi:Uma2 family endonuclease
MEPMPGTDGPLPNPEGVKLTYDDFVLFPDDGMRHELIDGEHYVTPAPNIRHQQTSMNLTFLIEASLRKNRIGKLFYASCDIVISQFDVVEPDLLYMSNERAASILGQSNVQGTPELVIEIASPATRRRDASVKRRLYERAGVSEYWIVNPDNDVIHVYRRTNDRFAPAVDVSAERDDVLTTPLLPGLTLSLREIFDT